MPQLIDKPAQADLDTQKVRLVKPAAPKPEKPPTPEDVLRAISTAISRLGDLQTATIKLIQSSQAEPAALMAVMARIVELHGAMQKQFEAMSQQPAPVVNVNPPPPWKELELTIQRDGFGNMNKVLVKREKA